MKKLFPLFITLLLLSAHVFAADMTKDPGYLNGEKLFKANCTACHAIDKKMVGPALKGVSQRRSEAWLIKWVRNNSKLRASGDADAIAVFNENNGVAMTAFENLSEGDVKNIITYVENYTAPVPVTTTTTPTAQPEQEAPGIGVFMLLGILLFAVLVTLISLENKVSKLIGKPIFNWNRINAIMFPIMLVVGAWYIYHYFSKYSSYTYFAVGAGTLHGVKLDQMFMVTLTITGIVFVICQVLAFVFPYLYRYKGEGSKGFYYPDNHKIEFWWTIVPAITLVCLLVYGLKQWGDITQSENPGNAYEVEVYARQFDWTARYPGADGKLGAHDYHQIGGANTIGLQYSDVNSHDDLTNLGELHLVVNKPVILHIRSQDVIHSAFIPNLRVQMNAVPGMPTQQVFTPTVTTTEMRKRLAKEHPEEDYSAWDYMLLCNKICGNSHYNMKMKVVVETKAEYEDWIRSLKAPYQVDNPVETPSATDTATVKKTTASVN